MKKVFAICLVALFLFNTVGYYFVFSYYQYSLRKEIQQMIRARSLNEACITIQITAPLLNPNFKWVGKGEFLFRGVLYDVLSEKTNGQITTFLCINDKKEEKLLSGLHFSQDLAFGKYVPYRSKHATAMLYHVIKLALLENSRKQPPSLPLKIIFGSEERHPTSILDPPFSPPPEIA